MALPEDDSRITPVDELFTYHIYGVPDAAGSWTEDPASYALTIDAGKDHTLCLSLQQLLEEFAQLSRLMVLQCMTNVHWGRVLVTGPRLLDVLRRAGIPEGMVKIGFHGAEGFDADLRLDEVQEAPDDFLLAHSMNEQPLTLEHGFPVRLAADGKYGYKWPKWIERIQLYDYDFKGHYERNRGWSDAGTRGQPVT